VGFIKDKKAGRVGADAQEAWDKGRAVFTPVLNFPSWNAGFSGGVDDIAVMFEAVLAVGWRLDSWTAVPDRQGRPQIMPLFVRPGEQVR
jgi:hypothetical protein